ncbi:MAG: 50S ribosomal protein L6 [Deltaproteobacteria bacterium]|nr:50S ribosomal protein L6 [Deltaproteobacteria bacterium]MBW2130053.1 50S ribosomal protein L6 [Deltaproteobacteria bacterium]MBW2304309.1 50S ribosomal protein L6 [Deltaproteobacteria bacterium]
MSRIGKKPIPIPKDVKVEIKGDSILVKGPLGELKRTIDPKISVNINNDQITLTVKDDTKESKSLHGLYRALVANMVTGVSKGFERVLEIVGVGYRAELSGRTATFHLGYSHPIEYELPEGITAEIEKARVKLKGIDKELLGRTAAKVRSFRSPEPYKGKGIKYADEMIRRKAGKTGAK